MSKDPAPILEVEARVFIVHPDVAQALDWRAAGGLVAVPHESFVEIVTPARQWFEPIEDEL